MAELTGAKSRAVDSRERLAGLLDVQSRWHLHSLPRVGLYGRQYAGTVFGRLREIIPAHRDPVGEHAAKRYRQQRSSHSNTSSTGFELEVTFVSECPARSSPIAPYFRKIQLRIMEESKTSAEASRRSTRIRAQIPVRLTSLDPSIQFSEACHTLIVNTQGCGVRLTRPFEPGTVVELGDLPTGKATATVANCVPLGTGAEYWLVGLALHEQGNIWGIRPAPADWGTEPAAMVAAAGASNSGSKSKSGEWPYTQFSPRGEFHPGRK
jgi:hypothetical protein